MKRVKSTSLAALIIFITAIITTPVVALEVQTPALSNIFVFGVHPDTPLVEHMPLFNLLNFEVDFRNDDTNTLTVGAGIVRYFDSLGNQMGSDLVFGNVRFEELVATRQSPMNTPTALSGEILPGQRIIFYFPFEQLGFNEVPATVDIDLFFGEYPGDPLSIRDIEIAEYHVPPGQTYIFPTGLFPANDNNWWVQNSHEFELVGGKGFAHRGTIRFGPTSNLTEPNFWVNQRYAYDIWLNSSSTGNQCDSDCDQNANHYAWEEPVYAMAEGQVILLLQGLPDNPLRTAFDCATIPPQMFSCNAMPDIGLCPVAGGMGTLCPNLPPGCVTGVNTTATRTFPGSANSVVIQHPNGEYSTYAHMREGSNDGLTCGEFVSRGQQIGNIGMSGTGNPTHSHFTTIAAPGPEALLAENFPIYFNNIRFATAGQDVKLQLDVSLPSLTLIDEIVLPPVPTTANPADGPGAITETGAANNLVSEHQSLLLPAIVEGVVETGDHAEVAIRGDGMEDIYRTDLAAPSTLQVDLYGPEHSQNLDVYVMNDDYRILNPTGQGTSPTASESICITAEAGAHYILVSNVDQDPDDEAAYILDVEKGLAPVLTVPGNLDFGNVCPGSTATTTLNVCNTGGDTNSCHMEVDTIVSSDGQFAVTEPSSGFPISISSDFCFPFQVSFTPEAGVYGPQETVLTIPSNDLVNPEVEVIVTANAGEPDINVSIANSGKFGYVCSGDHADMDITLLNQGMCDLTISDVDLLLGAGSIEHPSFELPSNLNLPLVLSHDADFTVTVRYTPNTCSAVENDIVRFISDDPDEMVVDIAISGESPCPNLLIDPTALEDINAFPATVVDSSGTLGCYSERTVNLRNNSVCPLTIESIAATGDADAADFAVISPTVFPILLPGGQETLAVSLRFTPQEDLLHLAPTQITGVMTVMSDDPATDHTAYLCGEGVTQSGLRVLVTDVSSGMPIPIDVVDSLTIQSKGKNRPGPINYSFVDHPLSMTNVCGNDIYYHVDQENLPSTETSGNGPKSSYQVKARVGYLQATESFGLGQCEFREFQLQLQDSSSESCLGLAKGDACSDAGECCSGKCKGPSGAKTCK